MTILQIKGALEARKDRSAWDRGVTEYCYELIDNLAYHYTENPSLSMEVDTATAKTDMLNGARDWSQYSYGGSALIYDCDIAERLCSPSELKKRNGGDWQPNRHETWLDVQARALNQACNRIMRIIRNNPA